MMKVDSVASQPDRVGRHAVHFNDGSTMRLYRQTVEDFGLYTGLELSEQEFKQLKEAAGAMSAKMRAVRIVAASSVSKRDLEHRLVSKGENPTQARNAVAWMSELSLVDDKKVAEQIVNRCVQKGYGLARAKQALYEKQIPKEYWDEALKDYPDQLDAVLQFLRGRLDEITDERNKKRVIEALLRRGHSYALIRRAMEQFSCNTDDMPED